MAPKQARRGGRTAAAAPTPATLAATVPAIPPNHPNFQRRVLRRAALQADRTNWTAPNLRNAIIANNGILGGATLKADLVAIFEGMESGGIQMDPNYQTNPPPPVAQPLAPAVPPAVVAPVVAPPGAPPGAPPIVALPVAPPIPPPVPPPVPPPINPVGPPGGPAGGPTAGQHAGGGPPNNPHDGNVLVRWWRNIRRFIKPTWRRFALFVIISILLFSLSSMYHLLHAYFWLMLPEPPGQVTFWKFDTTYPYHVTNDRTFLHMYEPGNLKLPRTAPKGWPEEDLWNKRCEGKGVLRLGHPDQNPNEAVPRGMVRHEDAIEIEDVFYCRNHHPGEVRGTLSVAVLEKQEFQMNWNRATRDMDMAEGGMFIEVGTDHDQIRATYDIDNVYQLIAWGYRSSTAHWRDRILFPFRSLLGYEKGGWRRTMHFEKRKRKVWDYDDPRAVWGATYGAYGKPLVQQDVSPPEDLPTKVLNQQDVSPPEDLPTEVFDQQDVTPPEHFSAEDFDREDNDQWVED
ncbi:uncharacterized protein KY384_003498 [Bacidia gigantensis]|uniref:uncharacterized protein n=1 Tax=Bacidia gigantensis TaxID=2732470 RepID=UPI001D044114|nr:uncharacterized protein KY384_003498 [Bacidia gigantensis]KAG8531862.1 hypothetical protein KY384_003498 [Bacidia gigantensis]